MKNIMSGVYPTMITPYKNGEIDYDAVGRLVDWFIEMGCKGVFAACKSSEIAFMSLKERVKLAEAVVKRADGRINVVASGHCGNSIREQVEELTEMSKTGIDALVLISNRFDVHFDGDDEWIQNAELVLGQADITVPLGIYECPVPYRRYLTPRILKWCLQDGRFRFIKDTCCNVEMITERLELLKGSEIMLFNANGQTLLYSLERGAAGYSGVMANFHPDLLVWLCEHYKEEPEKAREISNVLSMTAFTEELAYPCTAKYYLNLEGIQMDYASRMCDQKELTTYQKVILEQLYELNQSLRQTYL